MAHMGKNPRILQIYTMLLRGESISKEELAREYEVSEKSIQRDIEDLREFVEEAMPGVSLRYSGKKRQYALVSEKGGLLEPPQLLLVAELLLQSGVLPRAETFALLERLLALCREPVPRQRLTERLRRGSLHYRTRSHNTAQLELLWQLEEAIQQRCRVRLRYEKEDSQPEVWPQEVLVRMGLLYLAAFPEKTENRLLLCRLDRLAGVELLPDEPWEGRMLQPERAPFTTGGELYRIRFRYWSENMQPIHIWLPGARLQRLPDGQGWQVTVEVYGRQIATWLRAQGRMVDQVQVDKLENQPANA